MDAMSDSDDESWKLQPNRSSTSNAIASPTNAASSSSSSSSTLPSSSIGGIFDELNANLRSELQRTRAEVAAMKAEAAKRREMLEKMAAEPSEDGPVEDEDAEETARELRLLQDLLNEPLSSSEDESELQEQQKLREKERERERARAAKARAKTASSTDKRSKIEAARKQSASNIISPLAAALASANNSNPWDTATPTAASSSATPLSPSSAAAAAATQARSRAVLDSFRAKQSRVADYEKRQQNQRAAEGDIEGTVLLKSDLGEQCSVCLDDMRSGDRVASLACCHTFHYPCIVEWMERAPSCPLCKNETPFHPVARQARQNRLDKENPPQPAAQSPSSNGLYVAPSESDMVARTSSRPSSASHALSRRPTSATSTYIDPISEARIRQLRAERSSADSMVDDARFQNSINNSLTGTDRASMERRAASAAAKAVNAASVNRRTSASNPSQMSLSQLLKDTSLPGAERYALITGSMPPAPTTGSHFARSGSASNSRHAARDSITRTSAVASGSSSASKMNRTLNGRSSFASSPTSASSTSSSMPRPSSNSSNIRAAAAASLSSAAAPLSLAPMVSKIGSGSGKLVTGSTVHKSQHRMTK